MGRKEKTYYPKDGFPVITGQLLAVIAEKGKGEARKFSQEEKYKI